MKFILKPNLTFRKTNQNIISLLEHPSRTSFISILPRALARVVPRPSSSEPELGPSRSQDLEQLRAARACGSAFCESQSLGSCTQRAMDGIGAIRFSDTAQGFTSEAQSKVCGAVVGVKKEWNRRRHLIERHHWIRGNKEGRCPFHFGNPELRYAVSCAQARGAARYSLYLCVVVYEQIPDNTL